MEHWSFIQITNEKENVKVKIKSKNNFTNSDRMEVQMNLEDYQKTVLLGTDRILRKKKNLAIFNLLY